MTLRLWTISGLLTSLLVVSACTKGQYCDVYAPVGDMTEVSAVTLVTNDRKGADAIVGNELYYERHCVN